MIALMFLCLVATTWLMSSWCIMLLVGMVHHEILYAVIPISYQVSAQFSLVLITFTMTSYFIGGMITGAMSD